VGIPQTGFNRSGHTSYQTGPRTIPRWLGGRQQ
jgi:hypothetical protein